MQIDKETADRVIEELSHAQGVLGEGRKFGIRVCATPQAIAELGASDHPAKDAVLANIKAFDATF